MNQLSYYFSAAVFILAISVLSYYPALSNDFILNWDDGAYIINNPNIQQLSLENIGWMLTAFHIANWHPLTWFSHAIDYALFGEAAWGHHLMSIIFHALNSVWVFILTITLLYIVAKKEHEQFSYAEIFTLQRFSIALLTAVLFAIHPQHVESVAWAAERKDLLFFFFLMPALLSYILYTQKQKKIWYISSLLFFVFSLMSKPMAITLPIILLLFDIYPLKKFDFKKISYKNYSAWIVNKIPFLILALISAIITILAQSEWGALAPIQEQQAGLSMRLLNAANSLIVYIQKFLFPVSLSPFYPFVFEKAIQLHLINIAALLLITVVAIYFWYKSYKAWLIGWLFYIITLLPVLGLLQVGSQAMADRYTYLPMLPFYLLVGFGIITLYVKYKKLIGLLLILIIPALLITLTHNQTKIWRNELALWSYTVRFNPDSGLAQAQLGDALMSVNLYERSIQHLEFAINLSKNWKAHYDLGDAYLITNHIDEALEQYKILTIFDHAPVIVKADAYFMIAAVYADNNNKEQAIVALDNALDIVPNAVTNTPAQIWHNAVTNTPAQKWHNELILWRDTVHLNSESGLAQAHLGNAFISLGLYQRGIKHLERAVSLAKNWQPHYDLGRAYLMNNDIDAALKHYKIVTTIEQVPVNKKADAYLIIAAIYADKNNKEQAIEILDKVLLIVPNHAKALALKNELLSITP